MYIARNYNYPTAVFFSFVHRFLQDFNKVVVVVDYDDDDDDYYYYFQSPGFFNLLFPVFCSVCQVQLLIIKKPPI